MEIEIPGSVFSPYSIDINEHLLPSVLPLDDKVISWKLKNSILRGLLNGPIKKKTKKTNFSLKQGGCPSVTRKCHNQRGTKSTNINISIHDLNRFS
jgi:hypothetical protein